MNTTCPHCSTVFRVDPGKIPPEGVRARCSICRGVFQVAPAGGSASAPAKAAVSTTMPTTATAVPAPPTAAAPPPRPETAAPTPPTPSPAPSAPPQPAAPSPFGSSDPNAKARRLARALISDIVTYHPERRERSLESGTLKQEFKEEIRKSWEEYVEQVGAQTAQSTPFFRDALNDLLAKGQKVF